MALSFTFSCDNNICFGVRLVLVFAIIANETHTAAFTGFLWSCLPRSPGLGVLGLCQLAEVVAHENRMCAYITGSRKLILFCCFATAARSSLSLVVAATMLMMMMISRMLLFFFLGSCVVSLEKGPLCTSFVDW